MEQEIVREKVLERFELGILKMKLSFLFPDLSQHFRMYLVERPEMEILLATITKIMTEGTIIQHHNTDKVFICIFCNSAITLSIVEPVT